MATAARGLCGVAFRKEIGLGEIISTIVLLLGMLGGVMSLRDRLTRVEVRLDSLWYEVHHSGGDRPAATDGQGGP